MTFEPPAFGRRNAKPAPPEPSQQSGDRRSPAERFNSTHGASSEPTSVVPTTFRGVALGAAGVFCLELIIMTARSRASGVADAALATDVHAAFGPPPPKLIEAFSFFGATLAIGALRTAAIYALAAHAGLRWLRASSPLAYALGGLGVVYLLLAAQALAGNHLQLQPSLIELAGGALSGWLYRLASRPAPATADVDALG